MNTRHTSGAVLATLTALTGLLLSACSDDSTPSTSEQSPTSSESSSADPSTAAPSTTDETSDYRLLGPTSQANLEPGRWAVTAAGQHGAPLAVLDLPEGLNGGSEFIWTVGGAPENDGWIFGYYTVGATYPNPCTRAGAQFDPEEVDFPDHWVDALQAQRHTTTGSQPVPVTLGGYDGLYVELKLDAEKKLDFSTCREDQITIFESTRKGRNHSIATPDTVERYWLLDVDGERIVLTGAVTPETTDSQFEQLTEIVESVQFVRS
jgi:hypothetical protein